MVTFYEERPAPEPSDLTDIERALGVPIPPALRRLFVDHNGGRPEENHFRCSTLQTDVSECVEVRSGRGGALWVYELLRSRGLPRPVPIRERFRWTTSCLAARSTTARSCSIRTRIRFV